MNDTKTCSKSVSSEPKRPFRRLESVVKDCTEVTIPLHVHLLKKQNENIQKFKRLGELSNVHKENINASRTLEQLKADILALNRLAQLVVEEDLPIFHKKTAFVKQLMTNAIQEFIEQNNEISKPCTTYANNLKDSDGTTASDFDTTLESRQLQLRHHDQLRRHLDETREVQSSWNHLHENIQDLTNMLHLLSALVHEQQEPVSAIEQNLIEAKDNVELGKSSLQKALQYKLPVYSIAGAAVGSCIGGPLGLVIGLKVGALATTAVGCILGYKGVQYLNHQQPETSNADGCPMKEL